MGVVRLCLVLFPERDAEDWRRWRQPLIHLEEVFLGVFQAQVDELYRTIFSTAKIRNESFHGIDGATKVESFCLKISNNRAHQSIEFIELCLEFLRRRMPDAKYSNLGLPSPKLKTGKKENSEKRHWTRTSMLSRCSCGNRMHEIKEYYREWERSIRLCFSPLFQRPYPTNISNRKFYFSRSFFSISRYLHRNSSKKTNTHWKKKNMVSWKEEIVID